MGMTGEEYITKSDNKKTKLANKLLQTPFICVMKRITWGASNTPSLSIIAMRRPHNSEVFNGYKFVDGSFVHFGKPIKQEKFDDDVSNDPPAKRRKETAKPAKRRKQTAKKSAPAVAKDIISISDDSDDDSDESDASSQEGDNTNSDHDFVVNDQQDSSSSDDSSGANMDDGDDSDDDDSDDSSDDDDE